MSLRCHIVERQRNVPEDPEPRWFPGERSYAEPDWPGPTDERSSDEGYRAPEPRGGLTDEPTFNAFGESSARYGTRDRSADPLGGDPFGVERYGDPDPGRAEAHQSPLDPPRPPYETERGRADAGGSGVAAPPRPGFPAGEPGRPPTKPAGTHPITTPQHAGAHAGQIGRVSAPAGPLEAPTGEVEAVGPGAPEAAPPHEEGVHFPTESMDREALRRPGGVSGPAGEGVYRARRPAMAFVFGVLVAICELPALRVFLTGMVSDPVSSGGVVSGLLLMIGLPMFGIGLYALTTGAGRADPARVWLRPPTAYLTVGLVLLVAAGLAAS
jgi:hypothetical protein